MNKGQRAGMLRRHWTAWNESTGGRTKTGQAQVLSGLWERGLREWGNRKAGPAVPAGEGDSTGEE